MTNVQADTGKQSESPVRNLREQYIASGTVQRISVRPERDGEVTFLDEVQATRDAGLIGDHFSGKAGADRQVTLIQQEHLTVVAGLLGRDDVDPALTRRNLVVSGINLQSLKNAEFAIGSAVFRGTGSCPPCSKMERNLGPGGFNAMRGHGGITACVVKDGTVRIGDEVQFLRLAATSSSESDTD